MGVWKRSPSLATTFTNIPTKALQHPPTLRQRQRHAGGGQARVQAAGQLAPQVRHVCRAGAQRAGQVRGVAGHQRDGAQAVRLQQRVWGQRG